jgi:hypothetical protein
VHRAVLAMTDEDREKKTDSRDPTPRLPPRIRTEYDRLCEDLGGPADIGEVGISKEDLASYCPVYPSQRVLPVLIQYQKKSRRDLGSKALALGGVCDWSIRFRETRTGKI